MENIEVWLSDDEGSDHELEYSTDPISFTLPLTYREGQPGGYHVRNRVGQIQRATVSSFQGGSRKKPAFTASCQAKAMIHGRMSPTSDKQATLLVYEFKFLSRRETRIKAADILFEFRARSQALGDGRAVGPSVVDVRPKGQTRMAETNERRAATYGISLNVGPSIPGVEAGVTASSERSNTKDVKHYTTITGDNPADMEWGDHYQARFTLEENKSQGSGIPTQVAVVILLERENGDDFEMIPVIEITPNFRGRIASLASARAPDEPVYFNTQEAPFDRLPGDTKINPDNLGGTDLDHLWVCNMYNLHTNEIVLLEKGE